ncbi:MAG: MCP four helix bundle domain-containing protein [Bdellovibrio sp.]|nr:MCP four helix bundle domain-containing protein [Bdellovibrio sp.]
MGTVNRAKRFSLQLRLILMSAAAFLLTSAVGIFGLSEMKDIAGRTSEIADVWIPGIQGLSQIRNRIQAIRMTDWQLLSTEDAEGRKKLFENLESLSNDMLIYNNTFSDLINDPHSQTQFDEYKSTWIKYSDINAKFVESLKAGRQSEGKLLLANEEEKLYEEMLSHLSDLEVINYDGSNAARDAATAKLKSSKLLVLIFVPFIFTLALLLLGYYNRKISLALAALADRLKESADIVMNQGESLSEMAAQLSHSTESSAAALEQTAVTTKNINQAVIEAKNLADEAAQAILTTKQCATAGHVSIQAVDEAMKKINVSNVEILGHVEQNYEDMKQVTRIIQTISEKTKIINDIVFQTKLLSFNASVEAARAGDQGKGFSVVAEEIAKLAEVSGGAAREISEILQSSSDTVNTIVEGTKTRIAVSVNQSSDHIKVGVDRTAACSEALQEIVANAEKASRLAVVIVESSTRQSQSTTEINTAIGLLSDATAQNSSLATGTAKESSEMKVQSDILLEIVERLEYEVHGTNTKKKLVI